MSKQKIYIDGLGLVDGHFSGIGQYILGIVRALDELIDSAKLAGEDHPAITVIIPYDMKKKFKRFGFKHIRYKTFPLPFRIMSGLWYRGRLPYMDLWCGRGTYVFPRFVDMPLLFSKSIVVIYDLSFELHREYSDERNAAFLSSRVSSTLNRAKRVITISKNSKKEIVDFYGTKASHVSVATPATDPAIFYRRSNEEIDKVKTKYGIDQDYILALSNLEPRKNLKTLVDAYCNLPKSITNKTALLLVGVSGWKTEELFNHIVKKVEEGYNIIRPAKYVTDEDKPAIISGAQILVYPSHYEGFGMPPLEALACGIPVITANNSSLPEVIGKSGVMLDSDDIKGFEREIVAHINDNVALKEQKRTEGPDRASMFSWTKSAQTFLDVINEVSK